MFKNKGLSGRAGPLKIFPQIPQIVDDFFMEVW